MPSEEHKAATTTTTDKKPKASETPTPGKSNVFPVLDEKNSLISARGRLTKDL